MFGYNEVAVNIFGHIYVDIYFFFFLLSKHVGVEFLCYWGKCVFIFLRNCQIFFQNSCIILCSHQKCQVSSCQFDVVRLIQFSCLEE